MFLEEMQTKNIVLWGTGKVSGEFLAEWEPYAKVWASIAEDPFPSIRCVWDSNSEKQGTRFHGWEEEKPLAGARNSDDYCIIAIENYAPVARILEQAGYQKILISGNGIFPG